MFDKALIIHDTCYILRYIDLDSIDFNIRFLWHFDHSYDELIDDCVHKPGMNKELIRYLDHSEELLKLYNNNQQWISCFGVMSLVNLSFIDTLESKYNLFNTMNYITKRHNRCELERVFGLLCCYEDNTIIKDPSIHGSIHNYLNTYNLWDYSGKNGYNNIKKNMKNGTINKDINILKLIGYNR